VSVHPGTTVPVVYEFPLQVPAAQVPPTVAELKYPFAGATFKVTVEPLAEAIATVCSELPLKITDVAVNSTLQLAEIIPVV
jgi:hypothetical protein